MRDSGDTPKFLGTGNRFSTVTPGTSSEDRTITGDLLPIRAPGSRPYRRCAAFDIGAPRVTLIIDISQ
jgi:hypothetical protein